MGLGAPGWLNLTHSAWVEGENVLVVVFEPLKPTTLTQPQLPARLPQRNREEQGLLSAPRTASRGGYTAEEEEMEHLQQSSAQQMKQIEV